MVTRNWRPGPAPGLWSIRQGGQSMRIERSRWRLPFTLLAAAAVAFGACGPRGGGTVPTPPPSTAAQSAGGSPSPGASPSPVVVTGDLNVWTYPQGDGEKVIKAYGKAFEKLHPGLKFKLVVIAEGDPYSQKINTALQAHN